MSLLPHVSPSLDEVQVEYRDAVAIVRLCRPKKRNAINDGLIAAIGQRFAELPESTKAVVLHGEGDHFCAGLDLSELSERDAAQGTSWKPRPSSIMAKRPELRRMWSR